MGVDRPELGSAREMLDELAVASGQKKRRSHDRVPSSTRPISQINTVFGSDLLLAEEFLAANSIDETPLPDKPRRN